ncbi:MAG TPA: ribonuclease III [Anaerolineae bacterium]|nr:ribonuclease III [Anaerolineae bacterium]HNU05069.1 ribonuclease III [Anaerolineae bacterium]
MFQESPRSRARVALEAAQRFEVASGLLFRDKTLLQRALTHRSYLNETRYLLQADNERLEFLGDAVLDFIVGEYLYHRFPEMREGMLTNLRAALVREETLAAFAVQLNLGQHLLMGRGEAESGGRERPATLCGAFEALVGALYLDQDLEAVKTLLFALVEPTLPEFVDIAAFKDAKSRLQEWSQNTYRATPRYHTAQANGPDHEKQFTVHVVIADHVWGIGQGRSKQLASMAAAAHALDYAEAHQYDESIPLPNLLEPQTSQDADDAGETTDG